MKRSKLLTGLLSLGLTAALLNPFSVLATAEGAAADTGIATNSIGHRDLTSLPTRQSLWKIPQTQFSMQKIKTRLFILPASPRL